MSEAGRTRSVIIDCESRNVGSSPTVKDEISPTSSNGKTKNIRFQKVSVLSHTGESSNGRMPLSEGGHVGSNPASPAIFQPNLDYGFS